MSLTETKTYKKIHFAVMAIEASAKKAQTSGKVMHDRLKAQGHPLWCLCWHHVSSISKILFLF